MSTTDDKILIALDALAKIEIIALGESPIYEGMTDSERLTTIVYITKTARQHLIKDDDSESPKAK